jgi:NAD-dependent deacetylase
MTFDGELREIRARLAAAKRITVMTGAGVSAASGVPTFRGPGGLWRNREAAQLATPEAFRQDPVLVWEWYAWRRQVIAGCAPNPAHETIARWSQAPGFTLITQNVDGLHERAGTRNVVRYHGSIWQLRCAEGAETAEGAGRTQRKGCRHAWEDLRVPLEPLPPCCPSCGGLARPGVVWFGEAIPPDAARAAQAATRCDVFLSVGTSSVVYPAAGLVAGARARGAFTVEINPGTTAAAVDIAVAMPAETALPELIW